MHQSVRDAFVSFQTQFEGRVKHMYLDIKGLVTTGIGNLIDPLTDGVVSLPWVQRGTTTRASEAEIRADWAAVKAAGAGKVASAYAPLTKLELTDEAIDQLVLAKAEANEAFIRKTPEFASYDTWPADAQLGLMSMAWAQGASFAKWPNFRAAVAAGDWARAAEECRLDETGNPGLKPRNEANRNLFSNAKRVVDEGLDPAVLLYGTDGSTKKPAGGSTSSTTSATVVFLRADTCLVYDLQADSAGAPFPVIKHWTGLEGTGFEDSFRAVVTVGDKTYAFKGASYIRLSGGTVDEGYPAPIAENWPGMDAAGFADGIEAAVSLGNGDIYFFRGDQYVRYDVAQDVVAPDYPKPIGGNWPGMEEAGCAGGIDAAVSYNAEKAYFFRGDQYVRYDIAGDTVDPDYPQSIAANWPGMEEAGFGDGIEAAWVE